MVVPAFAINLAVGLLFATGTEVTQAASIVRQKPKEGILHHRAAGSSRRLKHANARLQSHSAAREGESADGHHPTTAPAVVDVPVVNMAVREASNAAAAEIQRELAEVQQNGANVKELQMALAAQVALLRESTTLQRVSTSRHGRAAAARQVKRSEALVKDTSDMLKESRVSAVEDAKAAIRETSELQVLLDSVSKEASEQLRGFKASPHEPAATMPVPVPAGPTPLNQTQAAQEIDLDDVDEDLPPKV